MKIKYYRTGPQWQFLQSGGSGRRGRVSAYLAGILTAGTARQDDSVKQCSTTRSSVPPLETTEKKNTLLSSVTDFGACLSSAQKGCQWFYLSALYEDDRRRTAMSCDLSAAAECCVSTRLPLKYSLSSTNFCRKAGISTAVGGRGR